jgi:hypothetical protein
MAPGRGRRAGHHDKRGKAHGHGRGGISRRGHVPFPWDAKANAAVITANFAKLQQAVYQAGINKERPTSELVRDWHVQSLDRVTVAERWVKGRYRGQGPHDCQLSTYLNGVAGIAGTDAARVPAAVAATFDELNARLDVLDGRQGNGESVAALYSDILEVCAWLHGEWIRIHPFADHNGSTARLMAAMVGLRYGIPLALPGKPRDAMPSQGLALDYNVAAANQMAGDDTLMVTFMNQLVHATIAQMSATPPSPQP